MNDPSDNVGTRLLFENERVRVWDLALAPGETLPRHLHRHDFLFVVIQGGALVHANPDDPADRHAVTYVNDQAVFIYVYVEQRRELRDKTIAWRYVLLHTVAHSHARRSVRLDHCTARTSDGSRIEYDTHAR